MIKRPRGDKAKREGNGGGLCRATSIAHDGWLF